MTKNYYTTFIISRSIVSSVKMRTAKFFSSILAVTDCGSRFLDTYQMCTDDVYNLLWTAIDLKARMSRNQYLGKLLADKRVVLNSIQGHTRALLCTTMITSAVETLGAKGLTVLPMDWEKEKYKNDIGRFYSLFCDAIIAQGHYHSSLCKLTEGGSVPVLNASSHLFRPFHALGTLMTLQENFHKLNGLTVAWIGPTDSVLNSFIYLLPKVGINLRFNCTSSPDQPISPIVYPVGKKFCLNYHTTITECLIPPDAVVGCDVIVTTNHRDMKQQITLKMLENANKNWAFLQDLPRSGNEASPKVFNHENSLVWQHQKNVFYCIMAALITVLKGYDPVIQKPNFEGK